MDGYAAAAECRPGCGACCIAPSISSVLPGMPAGKVAGLRCVNLSAANLCGVHGTTGYPAVCRNLRPCPEMCGAGRTHAMAYLEALEKATAPTPEVT